MTHVHRLMWSAVCALLLLTSGRASASDISDLGTIVHKWVNDLNKGDTKSFIAACEPKASIIDGFPPYAWGTCADWMSAYDANNKRTEAPLGVVAIGKPLYTEVYGGDAYLIYPATFTNVQKGKTVVYKGTWTMTLRKAPGGWTFTGSSSNWGGNYTVRNGG